jgi:hypothetical protein
VENFVSDWWRGCCLLFAALVLRCEFQLGGYLHNAETYEFPKYIEALGLERIGFEEM